MEEPPVSFTPIASLPAFVVLRIFSFLDIRTLCLACQGTPLPSSLMCCILMPRTQLIPRGRSTQRTRAHGIRLRRRDLVSRRNQTQTYPPPITVIGNSSEYHYISIIKAAAETISTLRYWLYLCKTVWAARIFAEDEFKNGRGTYSWSNGNKYEGEWKEDHRHGRGRMIYADGDKYEGKLVHCRY